MGETGARPRGGPTGPRQGSNAGSSLPSAEVRLLQDISQKLDRIAAILASQNKPTDKQIDLLSAVGCDSAFIGMVVGMEPGAVRTRQSRLRAKAVNAKTPALAEPEPDPE
jgi:hypothetical protein